MRWPHDKAHWFSSYNCNDTEILFTSISLRRRKLDCWQNTSISALEQKLEFREGRTGKAEWGRLCSLLARAAKNLPASAGDIKDVGLIPGLGKSPVGGHGNPL